MIFRHSERIERVERDLDRLRTLGQAAAEGLHYLSVDAGGGWENVAGAFCWYSSSYVPAFNGASLLSDHLYTPESLAVLDAYFHGKGRPYSLLTLDGISDRYREGLSRWNYFEYDSSPGMWLDGEPARLKAPPPGVFVARVDTANDLGLLRQIVSRVFHIAPLEVDLILSDRVLGSQHVWHYLGFQGERAVATGTMVVSSAVAGIWNVGTLPEYRRQGISSELMYRMVGDALEHGHTSTMLLASPDGLPMYGRLGYKKLGAVRMFAPLRQPGRD